MRVIGIAGWSGAGKTTLIVKLIPHLIARGLSVSTVKHAHHGFDVDRPGKDSYQHRQAGAREVLVASARRIVLMHENPDGIEPGLPDLLALLGPVDLVLVEGYRSSACCAKLEIARTANGKPLLHPNDPGIRAVIGDDPASAGALPFAHLDDVAAAADLVERFAAPVNATPGALAGEAGR